MGREFGLQGVQKVYTYVYSYNAWRVRAGLRGYARNPKKLSNIKLTYYVHLTINSKP